MTMKPLLLALLAILAVMAFRHREPDRAVMRADIPLRVLNRGHSPTCRWPSRPCDCYRYNDADLQPSDPYPASLLP